jgi:hypothetical protein
MEESPLALFSFYWWFSVVLVGIAINIVSAYLKTPVDNLLSWFSVRWQKRTDKKKVEFEALVQELRGNTTRQIFAAFEEMRQDIRAVAGLLVSIMSILLTLLFSLTTPMIFFENFVMSSKVLFSLLASFAYFFLFVPAWTKAAMFRRALKEARKSPTPDGEQAAPTISPAAD